MILLDADSDEKWSLFQKQFNNWTLEILNRRTSRDAACTMIIGKDAPLGPSCVKVDLYDHHWSAFYDETAFIWALFLIWRRFFFPSIVVSRVAQMIKFGNRQCILCTRLTSSKRPLSPILDCFDTFMMITIMCVLYLWHTFPCFCHFSV